MANEGKTFDALLSEAPLHHKASTVTLTGALARTPEEGKFALVQADGSAVTLEHAAVKSHAVLGSSFGQQLVQVELYIDKVPKETVEQAAAAFNPYTGRNNPGVPPFALATGHQVPAATLAQMEAMTQASASPGQPSPWWTTPGTLPSGYYKRPIEDGTYPITLPNGQRVWHLDQ